MHGLAIMLWIEAVFKLSIDMRIFYLNFLLLTVLILYLETSSLSEVCTISIFT